ncbi:MAG TPA: hypothetical protein VGJ26_17460 [Pirellulales bacterium]
MIDDFFEGGVGGLEFALCGERVSAGDVDKRQQLVGLSVIRLLDGGGQLFVNGKRLVVFAGFHRGVGLFHHILGIDLLPLAGLRVSGGVRRSGRRVGSRRQTGN